MKKLWNYIKPPPKEDDEPLLEQVHRIEEDFNSIKNRFVIEKQAFLTSRDKTKTIYPKKSKFTITEKDIINSTFSAKEFLVTWEENYLSKKKQKCIIQKPVSDLSFYLLIIDSFMQSDDEEMILMEKTGNDQIELRNYIFHYYYRLSQETDCELEARYRLIDAETIHSVVLLIRV